MGEQMARVAMEVVELREPLEALMVAILRGRGALLLLAV